MSNTTHWMKGSLGFVVSLSGVLLWFVCVSAHHLPLLSLVSSFAARAVDSLENTYSHIPNTLSEYTEIHASSCHRRPLYGRRLFMLQGHVWSENVLTMRPVQPWWPLAPVCPFSPWEWEVGAAIHYWHANAYLHSYTHKPSVQCIHACN